jgi:hypothetical protein
MDAQPAILDLKFCKSETYAGAVVARSKALTAKNAKNSRRERKEEQENLVNRWSSEMGWGGGSM